jgi:hypothetical protein
MNHKARNKDLIDQTILRIKEKYPDMDTFLIYDYNTRCDIISNIISIHEESMIESSKESIDLGLPFIGRLTIKQGRLIYDEVVKDYLKDNNLQSKKELTSEDRDNLASTMKVKMFAKQQKTAQIPTETRVLQFNIKVINNR